MTPLRVLRLNRGLTQAQLAERAGVSEFTVIRLERGQGKRPYPSTRQKLADALGVEIAAVDELRGNGAEPGLPRVADRHIEYDPHGGEP
jgi:transcriptional regulator with XRE-family HTH domain